GNLAGARQSQLLVNYAEVGYRGDDLLRNEIGDLRSYHIGAWFGENTLKRDCADDSELLASQIDAAQLSLAILQDVKDLLPALRDYVFDLQRRLQRGLIHGGVVDLQEEREILAGLVDAAHERHDLIPPLDEVLVSKQRSAADLLDGRRKHQCTRGELFLLIPGHLKRVMHDSGFATDNIASDHVDFVPSRRERNILFIDRTLSLSRRQLVFRVTAGLKNVFEL